ALIHQETAVDCRVHTMCVAKVSSRSRLRPSGALRPSQQVDETSGAFPSVDAERDVGPDLHTSVVLMTREYGKSMSVPASLRESPLLLDDLPLEAGLRPTLDHLADRVANLVRSAPLT